MNLLVRVSEGNDAEAIRFLEKLVDICVMMPRQLVEAFLSLGHVYFTQVHIYTYI